MYGISGLDVYWAGTDNGNDIPIGTNRYWSVAFLYDCSFSLLPLSLSSNPGGCCILTLLF